MTPTALIAEDEPLLQEELVEALAKLWPELAIVARAGDGCEALRLLALHRPTVLFLDIQMPGLTGLEVAKQAAGRSHVVFVTALRPARDRGVRPGRRRLRDEADQPAATRDVGAAAQGPASASAAADLSNLLAGPRAAARAEAGRYLRWVNASVGHHDQADHRRRDPATSRPTPSTRWSSPPGSESLIRKPIKELTDELDPNLFWQIHRSTLVNVNAIAGVTRDLRGHLQVKLKQRRKLLPVSERLHASLPADVSPRPRKERRWNPRKRFPPRGRAAPGRGRGRSAPPSARIRAGAVERHVPDVTYARRQGRSSRTTRCRVIEHARPAADGRVRHRAALASAAPHRSA